MVNNYVQKGDVLDYANASGSTITNKSGVLIGVRLGVALADIANNTVGSCAVEGVFTLPKLSTDAPAQGAALYWDNTNKRLTVTASGNTLAGYAFKAAASGETTVNIKLNA